MPGIGEQGTEIWILGVYLRTRITLREKGENVMIKILLVDEIVVMY